MTHISVVIPVFQANDCLMVLYQRLCNSLEKITTDFEIIMVEDCGNDGSWEFITTLAKHDKRVLGLQFSRNFGQHYGITAGLDHAHGDWVIVMDCDLQDQPEEILKLYSKAQEGFDVVLARRNNRQDSLFKKLTSAAFNRIFSYLIDTPFNGDIGNFRIISSKVVKNFVSMREQLRLFSALVNWMGFKTAVIEVNHGSRYAGKSSYSLKKLWKLASEAIIAFSDKPLRLVIRLGFTMSFLAFLFGLYIIFRAYLYGSSVLGWSSLITSIYFMGGIIIAILGVIGIYLGKSFDEVKKRPLYIIAQSTDSSIETR